MIEDSGKPSQKRAEKLASKTSATCPTCGAPADPVARPFCSKRCADIDLGRWLKGEYSIPTVDAADDTIIDSMIADLEATNKAEVER